VRLEGDDETGQGRLTIEGDVAILTAITLLVAAAFGNDEDCGDPDCPVHGDGESIEDDEDLAESA
jgi:hypothetical protein